jgi:hypothetical protein
VRNLPVVRSTSNQETNLAVKQWNISTSSPHYDLLSDFDKKEFSISVLEHIETIYGVSAPAEKYVTTINLITFAMQENYSFLNLAEVKDSFTLNAFGKFETKAEHYGRIDLSFISTVMNQYLPIRYERLSRYKDLDVIYANKLLPQSEPEVLTVEIKRKFLMDSKSAFKKDKQSIIIMPIGLLYDYAVQLNLLLAEVFVTYLDKAAASLRGRASKEMMQAKNIGEAIELKNLLNEITEHGEEVKDVIYEAKKMALIFYFESLL